MNVDRVLSAALAACCLFALGSSAATLDAAVDTSPDDVIDWEAGSLPLPSDDVQDLKRQIQSGTGGDETSEQAERPAGASGDGEPTGGQAGDGTDRGAAERESGDSSGASMAEQQGATGGPDDPTLWERLLALLEALLSLLWSLLPALVVGGVLVAGVHFRDRVAAWLARLRERFGPGSELSTSDETTDAPPPAPANEVERAWFEMVSRVGLEDDSARTPRECATEAVAAGADPDAVASLTETFEEVTYGGAPVTDRRETRARRQLRRVGVRVTRSEDG